MNRKAIWAGLAATLIASSCTIQEETSLKNSISEAEPVIATIGAQTRTSVGPKVDGAYKVHWSEGDEIIISTGRQRTDKHYYRTTSHGTAEGVFLPEDGKDPVSFATGAIAGYPSESTFLGIADETVDVFFTIPEMQDYVPGSFAEEAMPMISDVTYEPVLNFHNAAGVLKLNISTAEPDIRISDICITTSQYICGECGYNPATKTIFFDDTTIGSNEVILRCLDGAQVGDSGTPFHLVVPHQRYSDMTITVTTIDGLQQVFKMKSGKEITIQRSTITEIPLVLNNMNNVGEQEIKASVTSVTYDNFFIKVGMNNITSYFCGLDTKDSFLREMESGQLLKVLEYGTPYTGPFTYSGTVTRFQEELKDFLLEPGQTYILWFVPYKKIGGYTEEDIYYIEATTKSFTPGGSISVSYSNLEIDNTSISMDLTATGAKFIYAQLMSEDALKAYPTEQDKIDLLLKPGGSCTVLDTDHDIFVRKFLRPGQKMTLLALAIDYQGRYGSLTMEHLQTIPLAYNSMTVNINENIEKLGSSTVEWSVSGGNASSYRYIIRETDSHLWTNVLAEDITIAQEKMFLEPNLYYINHTAEASAKLSNMVSGKEYILIVVAVDENGASSVADSWKFTY